MKINCNKKDLVDAIGIVQKSVANKSTMPILEGIFIEAKGQTVTLRGSDIDVSIETVFLTDVPEEGSIVLDSKMFGDIIRKLPNNIITIETQKDNKIVNISAEKSQLNLLYLDAKEFPEFPQIEEGVGFDISQGLLKSMLRKVIFSISADDSRPILTGVLFDLKDDMINLVALDSFRMAVTNEKLESNQMINKVVSGKTLRDIMAILGDHDGTINVTFNDNHVLFTIGTTKITSRLLQGEFIRYEDMIPDFAKLNVVCDRKELLDATERASLLANEGTTNLIKFEFNEDEVIITSNSRMGKIREEVQGEIEGDVIEIAFNSKYIVESLKNMENERVKMEMNSPLSPCIIKPIDKNNTLYLILPVRISTR